MNNGMGDVPSLGESQLNLQPVPGDMLVSVMPDVSSHCIPVAGIACQSHSLFL